ncbi:sugar phosphate nucleotidyltransferase, partial [Delftia tsuruhatensis]
MTSPLLPVILCGGSGTRLWPLSRETYPKQFLALADSQTMLQQTATRLQGLTAQIPQAVAPVLVCNVEHRFLAASQLTHVGIQQAAILLEPVGRNTAPALTLAALHACADGEDPVLLAMPADHVVADREAFHGAVH